MLEQRLEQRFRMRYAAHTLPMDRATSARRAAGDVTRETAYYSAGRYYKILTWLESSKEGKGLGGPVPASH
jgi:hypothetical protein